MFECTAITTYRKFAHVDLSVFLLCVRGDRAKVNAHIPSRFLLFEGGRGFDRLAQSTLALTASWEWFCFWHENSRDE